MNLTTLLKDYWPVLVALVAAVGAAFVSDYRVTQVETAVTEMKGEPLKLAILERDVAQMRCEIGNVKRLLRNQPENDC